MTNRLDPIRAEKEREVLALQALIATTPNHAIAQILLGKQQRIARTRFQAALSGPKLAIIAEIKRRSPSKGIIAAIPDPLALANAYTEGGAAALSVLTDELFFGGSLADLTRVAQSLSEPRLPILRKDFIIDPIQIAQALVAGADAVLCIVALLGHQTKALVSAAKAMGIDVLVEIHTRQELDIALEAGASIIGVNNRDLSNFETKLKTAFTLIEHIPKDKIAVAESGIFLPAQAQAYHQAGFDAVLIGEALVQSDNPADFIGACDD